MIYILNANNEWEILRSKLYIGTILNDPALISEEIQLMVDDKFIDILDFDITSTKELKDKYIIAVEYKTHCEIYDVVDDVRDTTLSETYEKCSARDKNKQRVA